MVVAWHSVLGGGWRVESPLERRLSHRVRRHPLPAPLPLVFGVYVFPRPLMSHMVGQAGASASARSRSATSARSSCECSGI